MKWPAVPRTHRPHATPKQKEPHSSIEFWFTGSYFSVFQCIWKEMNASNISVINRHVCIKDIFWNKSTFLWHLILLRCTLVCSCGYEYIHIKLNFMVRTGNAMNMETRSQSRKEDRADRCVYGAELLILPNSCSYLRETSKASCSCWMKVVYFIQVYITSIILEGRRGVLLSTQIGLNVTNGQLNMTGWDYFALKSHLHTLTN